MPKKLRHGYPGASVLLSSTPPSVRKSTTLLRKQIHIATIYRFWYNEIILYIEGFIKALVNHVNIHS